jgi:hypothetical protein
LTAGGCFAAQILNETKMQKISGFFDLIGLIPVDVLCERKQNRHDRNHACSRKSEFYCLTSRAASLLRMDLAQKMATTAPL